MQTRALHYLRDDRAWLTAGLALATAVSWAHLVRMADMASAMPPAEGFRAWPTFLMWTVMMVAMMVPTALPGILAFATAERRTRTAGVSSLPWLLAAGYVVAWAGFSMVATGAQWMLHELAALSAAGALRSPLLAGGILVAAAVFQLTPMKEACLRHCRSPLGIVAQGLPPGRAAALGTGVRLGAYCIGCCWALMALMFVGGVMSLWWMARLTVVILLEKVVARWQRFTNLLAAGLAAYGTWLMLGA